VAKSSDDIFQRAMAALRAGELGEAERAFAALLKAQPKHAGALNLLGIILTQQGRFAEAEPFVKRALKETPNSDATLYNYGILLKALNRPDEALQRFSQALAINPAVADSWNNRGATYNQLHRYQEAIADFDKAIAINPNYAAAYVNKAISLAELKLHDQALAAFDRALALQPELAAAWSGRGSVRLQLRDFEGALAAYDKAAALQGNLAEAWLGRGNALNALARQEEALAAYERALSLDGNLAQAWVGRGNALLEAYRYDEAAHAYARALAIKPDLAEAWLGCGNGLVRRGRHHDATAAFSRALALAPGLAEAWLEQGNNFNEINMLDEAAAAYEKALALRPDLAKAWFGRGVIFFKRKLFSQALDAYDRALAIEPDLVRAISSRLHIKQSLCDWSNFELEAAELLAGIRAKQLVSSLFVNLSLPIPAADQFECAKRFSSAQPLFSSLWRGESYAHDRIRIAYVSSDLREHPVGRQVAEVFERADKSRFEVTAISLEEDKSSQTQSRIKAAIEHFVDAKAMDDGQIADYIRRHEIDIAVDLNGFTDGGRQGVFARRPAPVQVNYLGYAGTLGAHYYDYILGDRTVIPEDQFQFYCEKAVWLPGSYMPTESQRPISEHAPTRTEQNLPENGFVFCCFNAPYKLTPEVFAIWMRLLKVVDGSVLWLSGPNDAAKANLRREAEQAGVSPDRLIFAARVESHADHLARHTLADLFLDTLPYNAHATAVDALWAGLPVLTRLGDGFAGRVAASLLSAVGLAELITKSPAEYEALALKLAGGPALLSSLKAKLIQQRVSFPLFDSRRFTRNIEAAYVTMWERYRNAQLPAHFVVDAGA
jgi:predicted O-linked N-acetylglucosamine transferase (SPINDLY family)